MVLYADGLDGFGFFSFNQSVYLFIFGSARAFSSCSERGLLFVAVCGLLISVASLVVEHRLQAHRLRIAWQPEVVAHGLSSCGARA